MRKLLVGIVVAAMFASIGMANAENYPSRPILVINPFPAGGPLDTIGRILGERMRASLGQPLIVENVSGAGGSIGTGRVARAAPDGHTVGLGYWGTHVVNGASYALHYDVLNDFEPVALLSSNPMLIVARKAMPADDLKGLIGWLKANPGKASQGTVGVGSAGHLLGLLFQKETDTNYQFVPYRGAVPAMQDLVAGHVDMGFQPIDTSLPQVRAGLIKAYAVTANSRLAMAPEVPTVDEAGLPRLQFSMWYGLWAPKGTPKDVITKLNEAVVIALADPIVRQKFAEQGMNIPAREEQTPEALGTFQKAEIEKWWPIIKAANLKVN